MLASLWISRSQPYASFPSMFRGVVELTDKGDGGVTLVLTDVQKYTWEDYHGKSVSSKTVLWIKNEPITYDGLVVLEKEERRLRYRTSDSSELVTVELLI